VASCREHGNVPSGLTIWAAVCVLRWLLIGSLRPTLRRPCWGLDSLVSFFLHMACWRSRGSSVSWYTAVTSARRFYCARWKGVVIVRLRPPASLAFHFHKWLSVWESFPFRPTNQCYQPVVRKPKRVREVSKMRSVLCQLKRKLAKLMLWGLLLHLFRLEKCFSKSRPVE
jgi:hypothetical protein